MNLRALPRARHAQVTGAIILVSLVAHLWRLGLRPLAHDEAIDAWFSWQAGDGDVMRYDPVYHGPLRFYLEGPALHLFGTGAAWARLVAALAGVAMTAIIACSRRTLGAVGAPVAALVFTVSPTVLTVTRTGREDSLTALVSLGLLLTVLHILRDPAPRHIVGGGVLLSLSWAIKETTFLFGFVALWFFLAVGVLAWRRPNGQQRAAVRRLGALGRVPWAWAVTAFLLVFMLVFTSGFRYPGGLQSGFVDGIKYWWGQHDVGRGGQPWFFYLTIYGAYEWLLIGLAGVGLVVSVRRRSLTGAWLATMWLGQTVVYAWAGEKFAWLALHPLVPAVLLAGIGAQAIWARCTTTTPRRSLSIGLAIGLLLTAAVAIRPAITDGDDPRELLVTVQTTADVPPIVERLRAGQRDGTIATILVDQRGGGSWPWAWYLHDFDGVTYLDVVEGEFPEGYDALIIDGVGGPPQVPTGYRVEEFALRAWWVPDYEVASVGDLLDWLFTRTTWNDTASYPQYLVTREAATP
jgi:uncharacterized protein (TIGR03663 family)